MFLRADGYVISRRREEGDCVTVSLYMAAKEWDMAAAVASHLVKGLAENAGNLAYSGRRRVVASPRRPPSP